MAFFGKRKKRDSDRVPDLPKLDLALTLATLALFVCTVLIFARDRDLGSIVEFVLALSATSVLLTACKGSLRHLGWYISTEASRQKPRNLRKFADEGWRLIVHVGMTWYEYRLLEANGWVWWTDARSWWTMLARPRTEAPMGLRRLYIMQMGIWFVTAFSHKFLEAKHKDYFVMYGHHVATLGLVGLSYFNNYMPIGLIVLFLHDSSDIVTDLLRMVNFLGLDGSSGTFLVEAFFFTNLVTWAYARMWLFPSFAIKNTFHGWGSFPEVLPLYHRGQLCRLLLIVLLLMHFWWYCLFLRLLYRLLSGSSGHEAGRDYEGSSDSEGDPSKAGKKEM